MAAIISWPTPSSLYQRHQNTLLSLGLSYCPSTVSNHFAFPITAQRKGEVKQFTHKSPSVCPLVCSVYSAREVKAICSFCRTPLSKHSLMHIHGFYCRPPADYLTKQPPKLFLKLVSKRADGAVAANGGHCFQWESECARLSRRSLSGVRWMALTKVGTSLSWAVTGPVKKKRRKTQNKTMGSSHSQTWRDNMIAQLGVVSAVNSSLLSSSLIRILLSPLIASLHPSPDSRFALTLPPHLRLLGQFDTLACLTAHHVGPNKRTLIYRLYEYSHTAVCDTEIAAGALGPRRYPGAMPGQKPLHLGQDGPSRPWQAQNLPRSHRRKPQHMAVSSMNTSSGLQQIDDDTFPV